MISARVGSRFISGRFFVLCLPVLAQVLVSTVVHAADPAMGRHVALEATVGGSAETGAANDEVNGQQPADFKNRLEQRRISEYASFDRALFDRSFDVGFSSSYSQQDNFFSTRGQRNGVFVSAGLGAKAGISLNLDRSVSRIYDTFAEQPVLFAKSKESGGGVALNYLLLPETLALPQLVGALNFGMGKQDGIKTSSRGLSFSTSRTLESASLFANLQFSQFKLEGDTSWQNSRSVGVSYFLTVNHRLAAGLGYSVALPSNGLSVPSVDATVVYRVWADWVARASVSHVKGAQESSVAGFDLTYTFNP